MIGITGATGAIGGLTARMLAEAGTPTRLLVRNPERAPRLPGAEAARCDYADPAGAEQALTGVTTLLMISASESAERLEQHQHFVDAAAAAGVRHVVYTSFFGAAPDATFALARDHHVTEAMLRSSGLAWTFLRDNMYADFLPGLVGDDGVIRGPAGDGAVAAVARADVAAVAAALLPDPAAHAGATLDLTGPQDLTMTDVATILSRPGRPVRYQEETVPEAYESRRAPGVPDWQLDAWVSTYTAIAAGELSGPTDVVRRITGRAPWSLAEVVAD